MTITQPRSTDTRSIVTPVTLDLYRDIHKGIRAELFAVTTDAGSIDPADRAGRSGLADRVTALTRLLVSHAAHEDNHVQPAIEAYLPRVAVHLAPPEVPSIEFPLRFPVY